RQRIGVLPRTRQERIEGASVGLRCDNIHRGALFGSRAYRGFHLSPRVREHRGITQSPLQLMQVTAQNFHVRGFARGTTGTDAGGYRRQYTEYEATKGRPMRVIAVVSLELPARLLRARVPKNR